MTSDEIQGKIQEKLSIFKVIGVKAEKFGEYIIYEDGENTYKVVDIFGRVYCVLNDGYTTVRNYIVSQNYKDSKLTFYMIDPDKNVKSLEFSMTGIDEILYIDKYIAVKAGFTYWFISDKSFDYGFAFSIDSDTKLEEVRLETTDDGTEILYIKHKIYYLDENLVEEIVIIKNNKIDSMSVRQKHELPVNRYIMRYVDSMYLTLKSITDADEFELKLIKELSNHEGFFRNYLTDENFNRISDIYYRMTVLDQYKYQGYIEVVTDTNLIGYIDSNGNDILHPNYVSIQQLGYRYALLTEVNNKQSLFDYEKKQIVHSLQEFNSYKYYSNGKLKMKHFGYVVARHQDGHKILFDSFGNIFRAEEFTNYYKCYTCDKYDSIIAIECKYEMNFITNTGKIIENPAKISELNKLAWSNMDKNDDKIKKLFNI